MEASDRSAPQPPACLNCGTALEGAFCSSCGQEARDAIKTLPAWIRELGEDAFQLDAKILKTLRLLLLRPGKLTTDYLAGRRQRYTPPLRLYLIVSAVSIALMSAAGVMNLEDVLASTTPEEIAQLERVLGVDSLDDPGVQRRFDRRFNTLFPILNLITPLGLCLALKAIDWQRLLHAHVVFGLHLASAQVAYSLLALPIVRLPIGVVLALSMVLLVGLAIYFVIALRRVYGGSWLETSVRLLVLATAYAVIVTGINAVAFALILPTL